MGDLASVAGLLVTILGFVIAIFGIWRSKTTSEHARRAAIAVRDSLAQHGAIADLSSAIGIMGEIKRFHRLNAWQVLPDRYSELRRCLVAIKASEIQLSDGQQQKLQLVALSLMDILNSTLLFATFRTKSNIIDDDHLRMNIWLG